MPLGSRIGSVTSGTSSLRKVTSDPSSASDGSLILNTTDDQIKVWYNNEWQVLHTLSVVESFILMETGDFLLLEDGTSKFIIE